MDQAAGQNTKQAKGAWDGQPVSLNPSVQSSQPVQSSQAAQDLLSAIRAARIDDAEHTGANFDLRSAELARLEALDLALQPLFAALPHGIDFFDHGIVPSEHPRLFIDMISLIEMARDRRTYRFAMDTQEGRQLLAESLEIEPMVKAVTAYIARRVLAREKALASSAYPAGMLAATSAHLKYSTTPKPDNTEAFVTRVEERSPVSTDSPQPRPRHGWRAVNSVALLLLGAAIGAAIAWAYLRSGGTISL